MKKYRLLFAVGFIAALVGCQSGNLTNNLNLVVVEQTDTIQRGSEENSDCWVSFYVDAPVNGPQVLVDSVMVLINKEVYRMCEYCIEFVNSPDENVAYSEKDMFTNDGEHLLNHYLEKYKPLIEDSLWNTFGLELKMEGQTEKYVTYGVERFYCGVNCSSEKFFFIFDKRDGHLVTDIISYENLVSFFKDYPEYSSIEDDPWVGRVGWQFYIEDDAQRYNYGLLNDHFSLAVQGYGNHYLLLCFPYGQIFYYLSPEAQALVERHEENKPMLPAYLSHRNPDVNLEADTVYDALIGCVNAAGGDIRDTLLHYDPALEIYPKQVYSISAELDSPLYLLTYSFGHLLYRDEAMACIYNDDHHLQPVPIFSVDGQKDSVVCCLWYDQPLEASDGFPYDEFDKDRFGLHFGFFTGMA